MEENKVQEETRVHSKGYSKALKYYPKYWPASALVVLVENGKLYDWEYNEITGFVYPATSKA